MTVEFPSGPWKGFWLQFGHRWGQDLSLTFAEGVMSGTGRDWIGPFTVRGRYDAESGDVWWTKRYVTHDVFYKGYREPRGIWGTWELTSAEGASRDGFHIWPLGEGSADAEAESAEVEEPTLVGVQPGPMPPPTG